MALCSAVQVLFFSHILLNDVCALKAHLQTDRLPSLSYFIKYQNRTSFATFRVFLMLLLLRSNYN